MIGYLNGRSPVHEYASTAAGTVTNSSDAREGSVSRALHGYGSFIGPAITSKIGATHLQHVTLPT